MVDKLFQPEPRYHVVIASALWMLYSSVRICTTMGWLQMVGQLAGKCQENVNITSLALWLFVRWKDFSGGEWLKLNPFLSWLFQMVVYNLFLLVPFRLFKMGFAEQLREILHSLPQHRQTLLFSAKLPNLLLSLPRLDWTTQPSYDLTWRRRYQINSRYENNLCLGAKVLSAKICIS